MSTMYVGNCTFQHHDFQYRVPEQAGVRSQRIPMGGQVKLSGDLNTPQIEYIVSQHTKYGLVHTSEIDRTRAFIGLCWQLDKPIPVNKLMSATEINRGVLEERGAKIRKESAVAAVRHTEENLRNALPITNYEVSVVEDVKDGGTPSINEGVRVVPEGSPIIPPGETRKQRRAKQRGG